jgi:hypothetical protein
MMTIVIIVMPTKSFAARTGVIVMVRAQIISIVVYALIAYWYVAPTLKRLDKRGALTALLWVHVFRYVVLYLYVARLEGYLISDAALTELVLGDLIGAAVAAVGILLLRFRLRAGVLFAALVVVVSLADMAGGIYIRSSEAPRADATGVWWLVFVFFAPLILVSLPLIVWQLYSRRRQTLQSASVQAAVATPLTPSIG